MDVISEVINKGVPISTPIQIRCGDLLEICDNPKLLRENINEEFKKYLKFLNKDYKKTDFDIFLTMSLSINPKTLEKNIIFSIDGLITSLVYNLNFNNACNDEVIESTTMTLNFSSLKQKVEELRKVANEQKLKKGFPVIYNSYKSLEEVRRKIEIMKRKYNIKQSNPDLIDFLINEELKQIGLNLSIEQFKMVYSLNIIQYCKDVAESCENIINHILEIKEYIETHPLSLNNVGIDKEKLELYFTYRFIKELEIEENDNKQNYVYYIADYFRENSIRKGSDSPKIRIDAVSKDCMGLNIKDAEGKEITPKLMYLRFRDLLLENPELKPINFNDVDFSGMSLDEVNTFVTDYLKTYTVNWEIIPKGKYDEKAYEILKKAKHSEVDYERLKQLFMEKVMFYNELDPFMCIEGKKTFDGYIGYIFSNGIVVLDKFYDNVEKGKVSKGDAIYYMKIEDFYKLSHFPKRELMKMPEVGRIVHKGNWMETIRNIINQSGDGMKTSAETKLLIKTNNE